LIGCTTDGEITAQRGFTEDSSALLLLISDDITFAAAVAENISHNAKNSIAETYRQAKAKLALDPTLALVLPDGLSTMNVPIDAHLRSGIGDSLPIFGGSAGDGFRLSKTFQFQGKEVFTDAMPILLMSGEVSIALDIATGPTPYGDYYQVDKLNGNVIQSIDGVTALEFYERFFGKYIEDRELSFFPLAVYTGDSEDFVLRDPVEVNRKDGSISFVGRFEEPCRVRITQVTREDTLNSAHRGSEQVLSAFESGDPDMLLLFSCTSRRHVLGSRTDEEFKVLKKDGLQVPFFGFYCYGEIGPFANGQPVHFHSDTCVFVALRGSSS
ncbi:MAG: FIST signal transduction protein, partial [Desulfocapsaceae bacterium]